MPAAEIPAQLEGVMAADVGERVQNLIVILVQDFREPIAVAQVAESADLDVWQPASRRAIGIIDSWNARLRGQILPDEKWLCIHLITRVADLQLINLIGGKRVY